MAEPFLGEIRLFSFGFGYAPSGWAMCDGRSLHIDQYRPLYDLIGTTYGGSGATFNLPDFRGRTMLHRSNAYPLGAKGGTERVATQLPLHTHALVCTLTPCLSNNPANLALGSVNDPTCNAYAPTKAPPDTLAPDSLAQAGSSGDHFNMQPSLVINYCIALTGKLPAAN